MMKKLLSGIFLFQLLACTPGVQPIEFGHDQCVYCKMTIADTRYGAELVTKKGRVYKYDAAECLINALYTDKFMNEGDVHSLWVVDFANPATLINAEACIYLQSEALPSPMGMYITAVDGKEKANELLLQHGGKILDWKTVRETVIK